MSRSRRRLLAKADKRREDEKRSKSDWVAHPSRVLAGASYARELFLCDATARDSRVRTRLFRRDAESPSRTGACTRDACATRNEPNWTILHNKLPPTQLRELDLLGSHCFDGHRTAATTGRIAQLSFFFLRRSFFGLRCSRDR